MTSTTSSSSSPIKIIVRPSLDRGHADHGWLDSYHTFSFADYYDSSYQGFGPLRVINEDRVSAGRGFGRHPHRDFEIFSYVVRGELKHDDSLGHSETLGRGAVQFTSAGSGISHSEMNGSNNSLVHFLQIWVKPSIMGLKPSYHTAIFDDEQKLKDWTLIVSPVEDNNLNGSISVHAPCRVYATMLKNGVEREFTIRPGYSVYVHVVSDIQGMHKLNKETALEIITEQGENVRLNSGDGAFVTINGNNNNNNNNSKNMNKLVFKGVNVKASTSAGNNGDENKEGENSLSSSDNLKPTELILFELKL